MVTQSLRVRGSWRPDRTAIYWPPLLWPSALCLSCSPALLNRRPRGPLCWVMAFFTASSQQLLWTATQSGAPSPFGLTWLSLPLLVYNSLSSSNCNCLTSFLTELYNSSTYTQSPTQFLESHVGSSSSGNNCHAVYRSLSTGASVYELPWEFFTSSHFISQFLPTRFPLITAIRMCHFIPVHHLGMTFWPGRRSKYNNKTH